MHGVVITGWTKGLQVATCIRLLQSSAGLSPDAAKRIVEGVLRGERREVAVQSPSQAALLAAALQKIGALARSEPAE